jgi:hypothetical protein
MNLLCKVENSEHEREDRQRDIVLSILALVYCTHDDSYNKATRTAEQDATN